MEEQIHIVQGIYEAFGLPCPMRWITAESPRNMGIYPSPIPSLDPIKRRSERDEGRVSSSADRDRLAAACRKYRPDSLGDIAVRIFREYNQGILGAERYSVKADLGLVSTDRMHLAAVSVDAVSICLEPRVERDTLGRLHSDKGPAVCYRDGTGIYAIQGVVIPGKWLEGKLTAAEALTCKNMEQRRIACQEILGWDRIAEELGFRVINRDANPEIGKLVYCPGALGGLNILIVQCGTGRTMGLVVPRNMRTARQANAWTWGLNAHEYKPEIRT